MSAATHEDSKAVRAEAIRTCVGCGHTGFRSELLRVVAIDGVATVDDRKILPGRGAWIHADERCIGRARKRKALSRKLTLQRDIDIAVWDDLRQVINRTAHGAPVDEKTEAGWKLMGTR